MDTRWHVAKSSSDWLTQALAFVAQAETKALAKRGAFHIVLAGGATPAKLYAALAEKRHDWSHWHIWYGDERCLPANDPERNSTMAEQTWLGRVAIPKTQIHTLHAELGPEPAAAAYAADLAGTDWFDLVLLGLGEDGHTASLFSGHDWGTGTEAPTALPVVDAPKPPPKRVSLSAQRLSRAKRVLFLVMGAGKHNAIDRWRRGETIPAASITPAQGVDILLDQAAACSCD